MTDRAAEIAQGIAVDSCALTDLAGTMTEQMMAEAIAAALRSYGNERLEEAGQRLDEDDQYGGKVVRAFKSQPEQPDKDTGTGDAG